MDIITILYSASGLVFGASFLPQIITLLKDKTGAAAINLSTWVMFSMCNLVTLLYASTHTGDIYFIFCSVIGAIGNLSVLILALMRRFSSVSVTTSRVLS